MSDLRVLIEVILLRRYFLERRELLNTRLPRVGTMEKFGYQTTVLLLALDRLLGEIILRVAFASRCRHFRRVGPLAAQTPRHLRQRQECEEEVSSVQVR